jgi:hypothetical protein
VSFDLALRGLFYTLICLSLGCSLLAEQCRGRATSMDHHHGGKTIGLLISERTDLESIFVLVLRHGGQ